MKLTRARKWETIREVERKSKKWYVLCCIHNTHHIVALGGGEGPNPVDSLIMQGEARARGQLLFTYFVHHSYDLGLMGGGVRGRVSWGCHTPQRRGRHSSP